MKQAKKNQKLFVQTAHSVLLIALMALMVGVSCRFSSNIIPTAPPEPDPYVDDWTLVFAPADLPDAQNGVPYQVEISVENVKTFVGQFSVIDGKLPPGLSLERVPGENRVKIIGTPTENGTFVFTLEAACTGTNDPGQEGDRIYQIVVQ